MVAHLVALKLTLLRNSLRRSPWQVVGLVFGALYAVGVLVLGLAGLVALLFVPADAVAVTLTLAGSVAVLAWWVVPLVASGVDSTLDPLRFVTFAVPRRELLAGLALAGVVGVPGLLTAVLALGTTVPWLRSPAAVPAALLGAVLGLATCVVGARAWTTVLARVVASRRFREGAGIVVAIPLVLLGPILSGLVAAVDGGVAALPRVAAALSWTPLGAPWALAGAVAAGAWEAALAKLVIAVATVGVLTVVWSRALTRTLESPQTPARSAARSRGARVFRLYPATPTGAVAARCLVYWVRDPRYAASLVIVPLMPVLLHFVTPEGGAAVMLAVAPLTAFLMGWAISADVAFDGTAFWLQVSSAVSGRADRTGRVLAAATVSVPLTVGLAVASVGWVGRWTDLPAVIGVSLGVLLTALGLSSAVSARFLYPVPQSGQSAFATPSGSMGVNLLTQFAGWAALLVLVMPEAVLGGLAVAQGSVMLGFVTLAVGPVLGSAVLVAGIHLGARWYDRRSPELMQQVTAVA